MSGQRRRAVFPGKKKRRPLHATSANSFVAEIEVIIKAVCIVDSCVKLMRGGLPWVEIISEVVFLSYYIKVCFDTKCENLDLWYNFYPIFTANRGLNYRPFMY